MVKTTCQVRRCKRYSFNPWVGEIPWSREQQPTSVFLPGKFPGQRSLGRYSPWGHKFRHVYTCTLETCLPVFKKPGEVRYVLKSQEKCGTYSSLCHPQQGPRGLSSVMSNSLRPHRLLPNRFLFHRIILARILDWVAISSSEGSSPTDRIHIFCVSCIAGKFFITSPSGKSTVLMKCTMISCHSMMGLHRQTPRPPTINAAFLLTELNSLGKGMERG